MTASSKAALPASKPRAKAAAPHYLGGSNNLVSERNRREKAETALQKTKLNLRAVADELVPQVEKLSKAIKTIQIEKHHQLDLDEASQEILEALQQQINDIVTQQNSFPNVVEERLEQLVQQIREQSKTDNYELNLRIAHVQDCQDDLTAEFRLLYHELAASHEFLSKRMNAVDDAVDCVRKEVARAGELQYQSNQSVNIRVSELDEKLFALDKELLKIKLALPSAISAQMSTPFSNHASFSTGRTAELPTGALALQQTLQEISLDIASLKADTAACRSADRKQFGGLTDRLRESLKSHQTLKKELDTRMQQMQTCYDQMVTKMPSELSKRLLKAQSIWDGEVQHLRACVQQIEVDRMTEKARDQRPTPILASDTLDQLLAALQINVESIDELKHEFDDLRDAVHLLHDGQETTSFLGARTQQLKALSGNINRVESDVLGLYDWSREKVARLQEQVSHTSEILKYFSQHAKILPTRAL